MPATGNGRSSPVIADDAMSTAADFNREYILESEDGSPLPYLDFDSASDTLQFLDSTRTAEPKALFSPNTDITAARAGLSPNSLTGSHDSLSDSSSSKRTVSSATTKSTPAAGDTIMTDDVKQEWRFEDFVNGDADSSYNEGDGTINPSTIENPFSFSDHAAATLSDLASTSDSPSPFRTTADELSPDPGEAHRHGGDSVGSPLASTEGQRNNTDYNQYSLTQTMNRLTTDGSRDVSPTSNMMASLDSSPSALFNSPSPSAALDFGALPNTSEQNASTLWQNPFSVNPNMMQNGGVGSPPVQMSSNMHTPLQSQFNFSQPYGLGPYSLRIQPTPLKSRVETQIPIKLTLSSLPPGIKRLHLPTHTISKPKLLAKPASARAPDMLELHTTLVCSSAMQNAAQREKACQRAIVAAQALKTEPLSEDANEDDENKPQNGGQVQICTGCMTRERKRAARKKVKKPDDEHLWMQDENRRVIVFNTQEIKEWQQPNLHENGQLCNEFQVDAPMRIACYCRHHGEKLGFQVIFTITDFRGNFIAQAMSNSIMITDDHKTHTFPPSMPGGPALNSDSCTLPPTPDTVTEMPSFARFDAPFRLSHSTSDLQNLKRSVSTPFPPTTLAHALSQAPPMPSLRNLSRPASPTGLNGPNCKRRKPSGPAKLPSGLAMTRLDGASHLGPAPTLSAATSPFSPTLNTFPTASEASFGPTPLSTGATGTMSQPFSAGPPTPNSNDQMMYTNGNRPGNLDAISIAPTQLFSAPASAHQSRAVSPDGLRSPPSSMPQQSAQFAQALANSLYALPLGISSAVPPSIIHKIIPGEGPKSGGIEVTILGSGFHQGLEVMFGDLRATTTTFWGESSLVCLLPPSPVAGTVLVGLKHSSAPPSQQFPTKPQTVFKYIDDDEQQLMRTALTVLGHKMNGSFEDVSEVARRIIGDVNSQWGSSSSAPNGQGSTSAPFNGFSFEMSFEAQLSKVLELIDLDDSPQKPRLNLRRSTGQTMLHLACSLGLHRFVAGLLARGANPDLRDKGGYTPLHMASLNNHVEIVRRLISYGADPTLRTLSGQTAADVACSRDVIRAVRRVERHVRSRSSGRLHSRASSATSLRSLWDPLSAAQPTSGQASVYESGQESPEYSSDYETSEEDDPDVDDGPWLDMRNTSTRARSSQAGISNVIPGRQLPGGMASPSTAVAAIKDQFAAQLHQFQQALALHLQSLPQFPYLPQMPQMPNMAPLADYQAYLNAAAVFQRLTSMVPSFRPGSDQPPTNKELDGRWWDMSSLLPVGSPPPPAYEDIFPGHNFDRKQASAAQAAADAEADHKCGALFDQQETAQVTTLPKSFQQKLPKLLQIGRKNAITEEQQENLRRAHAERLKRLSRDRNLFFIWIPLLIIIMLAMLYGRFPGLFASALNFIPAFAAADQTVTGTVREQPIEIQQ